MLCKSGCMMDPIPTAEACKRLGIDPSTISRWVAAGKLKPVVGSRAAMWFDPADIERIRAERAAENGAPA